MNRFSFCKASHSILVSCFCRISAFLAIVCISTLKFLYACPLCKEGVSATKLANPGELVQGYNISVIVMIAAPFLLTGVMAVVLVRIIKR